MDSNMNLPSDTIQELKQIVAHFDIVGEVVQIEPLGQGLINDTYRVTTAGDTPDYVLQRVNTGIFTDIDLLQHNIEVVTRHIRSKLVAQGVDDIDHRVLSLVKTDDGLTYCRDDKGECWRMTMFIPHSHTVDEVNVTTSLDAGRAFGDFERMLIDLPTTLGETIPDFHNMELRARQLADAIAANRAGRVSLVRDLLDQLLLHVDSMCQAEHLYRQGVLPKRICHCDTKVNNMLLDDDGKVLCVIDLDTVMPSFVFSDYGDFLRTAANEVPEDCERLQDVRFREDIFEAFTTGYIHATRSFLTDVELEMLPFAIQLFPFMQSVRFMTDYLNGDTYYKIKYPDHNLVRARNQLTLYQQVTDKESVHRLFIDAVKEQR